MPLHLQTLAYAMKDWIDVPVDISNTPKLWQAKVLPAPLSEVPFPDDVKTTPPLSGSAPASGGGGEAKPPAGAQ